jgi:hypothetical protein
MSRWAWTIGLEALTTELNPSLAHIIAAAPIVMRLTNVRTGLTCNTREDSGIRKRIRGQCVNAVQGGLNQTA